MRLTFVETSLFTATVKSVLADEECRAAQTELLKDPNRGPTIAGTNGARKLRVALGNGGKSGGARIIYVHVPAQARIYFLFAYPKNVTGNISDAVKKALAAEVRRIKGG